MQIVFATNNEGKLNEARKILGPEFKVLSLSDIGCNVDIPETGTTFRENAKIKSDYVYEHYGLNCFADDSGLEVSALDKKPGIYSARYAGDHDDEKNINKLLGELKGKENRDARFVTSISLRIDDKEYFCDGFVYGSISENKKGTGGFGYDPVFIPDGHINTFAELSEEIKNKISHRAQAVEKLRILLEKEKSKEVKSKQLLEQPYLDLFTRSSYLSLEEEEKYQNNCSYVFDKDRIEIPLFYSNGEAEFVSDYLSYDFNKKPELDDFSIVTCKDYCVWYKGKSTRPFIVENLFNKCSKFYRIGRHEEYEIILELIRTGQIYSMEKVIILDYLVPYTLEVDESEKAVYLVHKVLGRKYYKIKYLMKDKALCRLNHWQVIGTMKLRPALLPEISEFRSRLGYSEHLDISDKMPENLVSTSDLEGELFWLRLEIKGMKD